MSTVYILCWRSFEKSNFMPSWKNVNSINVKHLEFLGYIISKDDICMDSCKVQTIVDWITLASI